MPEKIRTERLSSLQRLAVPSALLVQHPLDHAGGVFKHLLVRHLDHRFLRWSEETPDLMQERGAAPRQLVQFTADTTQLLEANAPARHGKEYSTEPCRQAG